MAATSVQMGFGDLLREWRRRRSLSQLELSLEADISARHLSFVETGRSRPSREIIVRLSTLLRFATEIKELDLNPLLGTPTGVTAVAARLRTGDA